MNSKQRQSVRAELVSQGYSWEYVDSWQPKITLYVHRPMLNAEGKEGVARGTALPNQPGNPDHMARKSRIGLLSWPPGKECKCKACRELAEDDTGLVVGVTEDEAPVTVVRGRPKGTKNKRRATAGLRASKGD